MTMEPAATRARTQGDKGEPFRPQRNAIFERPRHMHSASAAAARVHACMRNSGAAFPGCTPAQPPLPDSAY
eukprot:COSAG02_NODE_7049_length_3210_cov_2.725169_2_plen_71_part_00